ncbi:hypothetical protein KQI61_05970 [Anaerocolumna aminovalerica]|uniref:hypothetical protein n=1 Tax=Anaerocolumna aminovalerica TaxID=1527 RepID=UPI001C0EF3E5|nr:hypothetical protein [Anaerocolumna aminovalerica]MBU5331737.1 hypothetical protein [Anaerocolumna aminovalerica]
MLSNPEHGWCNVKIGDFEGVASYLTDVPLNCLAAFIQYFDRSSNINSTSVYFDEEGTEFYIVFDYYSTYIIIERKEKPELKYIDDIGIKQLAHELIEDLERDFDKWVDWECYDEPEDGRSEKLRLGLIELKKLMEEF